ncbi:TetR/AcrR family transcriptional regulator [Cohaesibacter celericrescens]|uniref:HTH tetR-type domain-containing protein n=1 Tax=Cohaesibacter celericrescens TaxID=2067669 RepID=A0A2N5XVB0_9HYPH|nr:TetR/AcrR family transcriptional regulator [Cohaesibacter celericrescens]PLW78420.1 hypothetical protein C0081_04825 [Cohaesibacter celericrescens]
MPHRRKKFTEEERSTRDLILDLTEKEIGELGIEGLRLKGIAQQVGIQLPSLYAHFAGRKELLEALAERLMDEILLVYRGLDGLPPREALLASADMTIEFYLQHRGYARLVLADFPTPYDYSIFNRTNHKIVDVLDRLDKTIKLGVAENTVRDIPADLFLSFRMGITLFPLFMRADSETKEMVKDPEVIERIKLEANRLLASFISVP